MIAFFCERINNHLYCSKLNILFQLCALENLDIWKENNRQLGIILFVFLWFQIRCRAVGIMLQSWLTFTTYAVFPTSQVDHPKPRSAEDNWAVLDQFVISNETQPMSPLTTGNKRALVLSTVINSRPQRAFSPSVCTLINVYPVILRFHLMKLFSSMYSWVHVDRLWVTK